jgi:pSer/pThr/pTyr-binding forkhead associated (FHA) protein
MYFRVGIEGGPKEEIKIEGNIFSLGRSLKNDIPVAHESVSRQHLKIRIERGKFYVTDLDTANGTFMGEEQLIPNEEKEWPVFLPLRLGLLATVEVLEDEPPPKEEYNEYSQISERVNLKLNGNQSTKTKTQNNALPAKKIPKKGEGKKASPFFNFKTVIAILLLVWLGNDYYVKEKNQGKVTEKTASKGQENVISEVIRKEISDLDVLGPCAGEALKISCEKLQIKTERGEGLYLNNNKLYVVLNLKERLLNGEVQFTYPFSFGKEKEIYLMAYFLFKHREEMEDKPFSEFYILNGKNIFYLENLITVPRQNVYSFSERDLIQIFTDLANGTPLLFKQLILPTFNVFTSS